MILSTNLVRWFRHFSCMQIELVYSQNFFMREMSLLSYDDNDMSIGVYYKYMKLFQTIILIHVYCCNQPFTLINSIYKFE